MLIERILRRAAAMCPEAYRIQKLSLIWACILLTGALLLLEGALPLSADTYAMVQQSRKLTETASAILLVGVVGAVCIEERRL